MRSDRTTSQAHMEEVRPQADQELHPIPDVLDELLHLIAADPEASSGSRELARRMLAANSADQADADSPPQPLVVEEPDWHPRKPR